MYRMIYDKGKLEKSIAKYKALSKTLPGAIGQELYAEYEKKMTEIKTNDVPWQTGNLSGTGMVDLPSVNGENVIVRGHFGGQAATYAVRVHEDPNMYHPHGRYKYLSGPMRESIQIFKDAIKRGIKIALSGGRQ